MLLKLPTKPAESPEPHSHRRKLSIAHSVVLCQRIKALTLRWSPSDSHTLTHTHTHTHTHVSVCPLSRCEDLIKACPPLPAPAPSANLDLYLGQLQGNAMGLLDSRSHHPVRRYSGCQSERKARVISHLYFRGCWSEGPLGNSQPQPAGSGPGQALTRTRGGESDTRRGVGVPEGGGSVVWLQDCEGRPPLFSICED